MATAALPALRYGGGGTGSGGGAPDATPAVVPAAAPLPPAPSDPTESPPHVPDVVEDRRVDSRGNVVIRRYTRGRLLGKGGFAKCFKFYNAEKDKAIAGKVVDKASLVRSRAKQKLLAEIKIHRSLSHPFVVGFDSFFEDRANVYIMLELCPHQTLVELVRRRKRLPEAEAAYWLLQLLDATRYLHGHAIIHRDLKLGNLFIGRDMALRVGDFGLATQVAPDERKRTVCGTPNYIAPEILDEGSGGHSFQVDTWAIGVIAYTLMVGRPPFETADVKSTYARIRAGTYAFPPDVPLSPAAVDLITRILQPAPADRPGLDDVLRHAFFTAPGVRIPARLPVDSLTEAVALPPATLVPGAALVADMLARPHRGLLPSASVARAAVAPAASPPLPGVDDAGRATPPAEEVGGGAAAPAAHHALRLRPGSGGGGVHAQPAAGGGGGLDAPPSKPGFAAAAPRRRGGGMDDDGARGGAGWGVADKENAGAAAPAAAAGRHAAAPPPSAGSAVACGPAPAVAAAPRPPPRDAVGAARLGGAAAAGVLQSSSAGGGSGGGGGANRGAASGGAAPASVAPSCASGAAAAPSIRSGGGGGSLTHAAPAHAAVAGVHHPHPLPPRVDVGATAAAAVAAPRASPAVAHAGSAHRAAGAAPAPPSPAAPLQPQPQQPQLDDTFRRVYAVLHGAMKTAAATAAAAAAHGAASPPSAAGAPRGAGGSGGGVAAVTAALRVVALSAASPSAGSAGGAGPMAVEGDEGSGALSSPPAAGRRAPRAGPPPSLSAAPAPPPRRAASGQALSPAAARLPWVTTFIDFSSKYGLGYLLSNGSVGVYFNDSTRIVAAPGGAFFEYWERAATAGTGGSPGGGGGGAPASAVRTVVGTLAAYPPDLKKKVTLLRHFRGYLLDTYGARRGATAGADARFFEPPADAAAAAASAAGVAGGGGVPGPLLPVTRDELTTMGAAEAAEAAADAAAAAGCGDAPPTAAAAAAAPLPHLRKWTRTRRALLFRLSCGAVQVAFLDGSTVLLSSAPVTGDGARAPPPVAVFMDRFGRREEWDPVATLTHPAAAGGAAADGGASGASPPQAQRSGGGDEPSARRVAEMSSRLRYAHDVLSQLTAHV